MINNDHRPGSLDGPAPTPGLGADSWSGLEPEAIGARQRTAAGRDLAHRVDAHRPAPQTEGSPGVASSPADGGQSGSEPSGSQRAVPRPSSDSPRLRLRPRTAAAAHPAQRPLEPVLHRDPSRF